MLTKNQQIMREIHNEDPDINTWLDGYTIFMTLKDNTLLDEATRTSLWQCSTLERTIFGDGFIDENSEKLAEKAPALKGLMSTLIKSFLDASIEFEQHQGSIHPASLLKNQIKENFARYNDLTFTDESAYLLMSRMIECQSIAAWVLVCDLASHHNESKI